ncbi:hypothetical protein XELAEV_18037362mg [Xenopus laevis]|uniref:Uncharacterized protein n=1 Tax=Xenopus laevis TaxID=8355 RepID=A0A974HAK5_XENLA|nr:hypothetical protein XELAEV_18037362mg [Xenopus laevis]
MHIWHILPSWPEQPPMPLGEYVSYLFLSRIPTHPTLTTSTKFLSGDTQNNTFLFSLRLRHTFVTRHIGYISNCCNPNKSELALQHTCLLCRSL